MMAAELSIAVYPALQAGDTPLIYACMKNHIRVVEELAKSGADLTIKGLVCNLAVFAWVVCLDPSAF